ncbi:GNAT family N-acetyltransferase [Pseudoleptotrichia goodfellowii]|uniref:Acetyltransferase n=1 Tax=Pseudoleptotrichia goodfellowii TaxID=157692 RepID=A0A510J7H7_9FUSO|nr:N-acetyltransferase [Pseudoleptotrichia goodfellowii]BBM35230.1 acetyltransferase [Pseudoleptotrichia goodfellowii]
MNSVIIRPAELKDVEKMALVHVSAWKSTYKNIFSQDFLNNLSTDLWIKRFNDMIVNKRSFAFVAEFEKKITGDIIWGKSRDKNFDTLGEIYAINILPDYQKRNIGKTLILRALSELQYRHCYNSVFLKVVDKNENARKFYEHMGFKDTNIIIKDKIEDFYFNEIVYRYDFV